LLDEFQDTDPLQIELAALIADPDTVTTDWRQLKPRPGALFFVGDPKQSIYGFRRADISLYLAAQEAFGSEAINLERNFRTTGPVIGWVNSIFSRLITPQAHAQPNYVPLVAQREGSLVGPSVTLLGHEGHEKIKADQRRIKDATEVAATITTALAEGWTVLDRETNQWRSCRPGDIAILVRTRKPVAELAKALEEADIPCRVEAGSDPWKNDEVRDLLTTLRAIDDPTDELALITALRSPLFGCSDDDLYAFVSHGGNWNHQDPGTVNLPDDHPVRAGLAWMEKIHEIRPWSNALELLERVVSERKAMELAMAHQRPRDAWRRIRTFTDTTRTYCELRSGDLRSFLHWCGLHAHDEVKVDEVVPPEPDDDAVRILTIHASKGLEFPICVLADLGSKRTTRALHVSFPNETSGIAVGIKAGLNNNLRELTQDQTDHREHLERLRLLYVAATRARDHLVISLHRQLSKKPPEKLADASSAEVICEVVDPEEVTLLTPVAQPFATPAPPQTSDLPDLAVWRDDLAAVQERSNRRPTVAATSLTPESKEEDAHTAYGEAGRHGPAAGRAVHKALEIIDFSSDGQAEARQAAAAEDADQKLVASMVSAALRSPSVTAAAQSDHWRELYVAASVDPGLLLEGYIDLAYRDGDGLVIVDYKTDGYQTSEDLDAKVAHYRLQGAAYALMAEAATGLPIKRMVFCFLGNGPAQERSLDDLPAAMKEAQTQAIATR
jgi:ATP-dependent exoDNAse (exonuclease V) beta subunit